MRNLLFTVLFTAALSSLSLAQDRPTETDIAADWCLNVMGQPADHLEARLSSGHRVDCIVDTGFATYAVEVDWARGQKHLEGLGQALLYAALTGHRPGLALLIHGPAGCKHLEAVHVAIAAHGLDVRVWALGYGCDAVSW